MSATLARVALAPAKVNLGLFVGPVRAEDGRHELVSVMQSVSLADELRLERGRPGAREDEVRAPAVPGPSCENLAARALAAFREATGWDGPPVLVSIEKRVPVAAGMGGGSADAAAALRLAGEVSGLGDEELLLQVARRLGADVPAQVRPGRWLARGAGERLAQLPQPRPGLGVLVLEGSEPLSTAAVYAQADRIGVRREGTELEAIAAALEAALRGGEPLPADPALLANDLQPAAMALCPAIEPTLEEARGAGADVALVSGSGPTVVGLFAGEVSGVDGPARAARAAEALAGRTPPAVAAHAVDADFARPRRA